MNLDGFPNWASGACVMTPGKPSYSIDGNDGQIHCLIIRKGVKNCDFDNKHVFLVHDCVKLIRHPLEEQTSAKVWFSQGSWWQQWPRSEWRSSFCHQQLLSLQRSTLAARLFSNLFAIYHPCLYHYQPLSCIIREVSIFNTDNVLRTNKWKTHATKSIFHCKWWDHGGVGVVIGFFIPVDQKISRGPREISRGEGNLEVRGDEKPNTSRLEALYGHSLIINPSLGMYQEIHP